MPDAQRIDCAGNTPSVSPQRFVSRPENGQRFVTPVVAKRLEEAVLPHPPSAPPLGDVSKLKSQA